jgi:hypothetical protein
MTKDLTKTLEDFVALLERKLTHNLSIESLTRFLERPRMHLKAQTGWLFTPN